MKIIDLLNKIANKEELPKTIKFNDSIYEYKWSNAYQESCYVNDNNYRLLENLNLYSNLNDELKIIEEPKKIEKLNDELGLFGDENMQKIINELNYTRTIINKLTDEINNLKEND